MAECNYSEELQELMEQLKDCPKIERVASKLAEIVYHDGSRKLVELEFANMQFKEPELIPSSHSLAIFNKTSE